MLKKHGTARRVFGRRTALPFVVALLTACGDPAPGESVEEPPKEGPEPEVVAPSEALQSPDITKLDLGTMEEAEIGKLVPENSRCTFSYTVEGKPVFAASISGEGGSGVTKIQGKLVSLQSSGSQSFDALKQGGRFQSNGLIIDITEVRAGDEGSTLDKEGAEANLHFELTEEGHVVDYRGWYRCRDTGAGQEDQ